MGLVSQHLSRALLAFSALLLAGYAGARDAERAAVVSPQTPLAAAVELLERGAMAQARAAFAALAEAGDPRAQDALAAMLLEGLGGPADREAALVWYCRLAHQPVGGRLVARALWFLAEYFRTGGGLPGKRYLDGARSREDPVKAYFWFQILALQGRYYEQVTAEGVRLGRIGRDAMARQLEPSEREQVEGRLEAWSPAALPQPAERCLALPRG